MKFLVSLFFSFSFNLASIPGQMDDTKQDYRYELRLCGIRYIIVK